LQTNISAYEFGGFRLDLSTGAVLKGGEVVKLRPKVFEALKYLVENSGRLVSKKELIEAVWPDSFVTDDSLVQCTVELRRALDDQGQQLLKTVPRRGYLFTANVVRHTANQDVPRVTEPFGLSETRVPPPAKTTRKRIDLPKPRTSLVGRDRQVAEATELLLRPNVRLFTLIGPGGAGKTRLALAVATDVSKHFPAGVQFVGLSAISDPALVGGAIAKALGIQQVANRTIPEMVEDEFRDSEPFLLLLDNFEQVLPAATLVAEVLEACPSLKIVVTSRECLRIYGEQEFPVAPLEQDSAIELFVERARAARPNFAITSENAPAIREICTRLDGLPLAIELAAARTRVVSPGTMLDRLQSRLQLLTGGSLDLPARQQTLRSAIDWSHDLLSEPEQRLFRRISVFVGGCTLEAAEAVCNTNRDLDLDLFEAVSSLLDKNLLQNLDIPAAEPRFTMLETIREYALERLVCGGEEFAVRRAHAAYCLVLAEEGNPELNSADRAIWLSRCDIEIDNFRSALDFVFKTVDLDWGLRLCIALFKFWDMREHLTEGHSRLNYILRLTGAAFPRERARVSMFLGALSAAQGDFVASRRHLQDSLTLYTELEDKWGVAASLNALAVAARDGGDYSYAQENFEKSLACWRALSDRLATARCLHNLANVVRIRGDYSGAQLALAEATTLFEELGDRSGAAWSINQRGDIAQQQGAVAAARAFYESALSAFREAGDSWGTARSLADLGHVCCLQGEYDSAWLAYREAIKFFEDLGHRRGLARSLEGCACLALAQGEPARALKLAAAASHLRCLIGAPLPQAEQVRLDETLQRAWTMIGNAEGKAAWHEGSAMNVEKAIQYSLS
jgi:predicted ATPase/DNA-binding winged helix-turn-helix (wHTH) protein